MVFQELKRSAFPYAMFFVIAYIGEICGVSGIFSIIPEAHRDQIGNILVIISIIFTAYLKVKPSKSKQMLTDLVTIVLACVVSLPLMKLNDYSFLNIINIILVLSAVFFMAFCSAKEMLNEKYCRFIEYLESPCDDHDNINSYKKNMRSTMEVATKYVAKIESKLIDKEDYDYFFIVKIDSRRDYLKMVNNYYALNRYFESKGYQIYLQKIGGKKLQEFQVKIRWLLND